MNALRILIYLVLIIIISSCKTSKLISEVQPSDIQDLAYFTPYSYISIIEKGNKIQYNDSASLLSKELNKKAILNFSNVIPLSIEIEVEDTNLNQKLEKEIHTMFNHAFFSKDRKSKDITISTLVDFA